MFGNCFDRIIERSRNRFVAFGCDRIIERSRNRFVAFGCEVVLEQLGSVFLLSSMFLTQLLSTMFDDGHVSLVDRAAFHRFKH